jgi:hypothetical protein
MRRSISVLPADSAHFEKDLHECTKDDYTWLATPTRRLFWTFGALEHGSTSVTCIGILYMESRSLATGRFVFPCLNNDFQCNIAIRRLRTF